MGTNANTVINDEMTLQEKLDAIDQMMRQAQEEANQQASASGELAAPVDPADLTMCEGCQ